MSQPLTVDHMMSCDCHVTREPQVPQRKASLETDVMSKEEIVYLAGRKDPVLKKSAIINCVV